MKKNTSKLDDVIDFFLSIPGEDASDAISPMKLQKLLYYAQGFALAIFGKELFPEDFEAWQYGPVIPSVYQRYKSYGNGALPKVDLESFDKYTKEEKDLLDDVYTVFGQYSAWALSDMTHETPPWRDTKPNAIITKQSMKNYFMTQLIEK